MPRVREHPILPTAGDGGINWDAVMRSYLDRVLSPFAKRMVRVDRRLGHRRNLLVEELLTGELSDRSELDIVDLGCGPGLLLRHVRHLARLVLGIDKSTEGLAHATREAGRRRVPFVAMQADITKFAARPEFDLVVSVNSILPPKRSDVIPMLESARGLLRPGGRFLAILPAYDSMQYLRELVVREYQASQGSGGNSHENVEAFIAAHRSDDADLLYAEDGVHAQAHHTPESIEAELSIAGLRLVHEPRKVKYPWGVVRRFGYGYRPGEREIWDWYIAAEASDE